LRRIIAAAGQRPERHELSGDIPRADLLYSAAMERRTFLQCLAAGVALPLSTKAAPERPLFVGQMMDAVGFVGGGVDPVLDDIVRRTSANALLLDVFWLSRDGDGRPLPGRVSASGDPARGVHMGRVRPGFYRDTGFDPARLPVTNPNGVDLLAVLRQSLRARDMRLIAIVKDIMPEEVPGIDVIQEHDFNGDRATTVCKNNPYYRNFLRGLMADLIESYRVDGILYMAERQGPFLDTLGARFRGKRRGLPGTRTCFCPHCRATARARGIDVDRAVTGFDALARFVENGRARRQVVDGYHVTFWRILLRHPELLAWEQMWHDNVRDTLRMLYDRVKEVDADVLFGSHVWHNHIMSPIYRAAQDLSALTPYSDFLKLSLYRNVAGPRMASYIESVADTMYGDVPPDELLQFHYRVFGYDEAPYERLRETGLKNDFVYRETKRALEHAAGSRTMIWPAMDVDIPILSADLDGRNAAAVARNTRADVAEAFGQALRAGAPGVIVSREYTEMTPEHLSGVGDAVRAWVNRPA
jgi:hypothetical protein